MILLEDHAGQGNDANDKRCTFLAELSIQAGESTGASMVRTGPSGEDCKHAIG